MAGVTCLWWRATQNTSEPWALLPPLWARAKVPRDPWTVRLSCALAWTLPEPRANIPVYTKVPSSALLCQESFGSPPLHT